MSAPVAISTSTEGEDLNSLVEEGGHEKATLSEIVKATIPLGFLSFGGPMAHIALLERVFVRERKWITSEQMTELLALSQSLPGPTSTQVVIAVGTLASDSLLGGFLAFFFFGLPGTLVLFISGLLLRNSSQKVELNPYVSQFLNGVSAAAIAIVAQAGWRFALKVAPNKLTKTLLLLASVAFLAFPQPSSMIVILVLGGLAGFLDKLPEENPANANKAAPPKTKIWFTGLPALITYIGLFLFGIAVSITTQGKEARLFEGFYRIGSLIFGGGHVVLPMILSEFTKYSYLTESEFINGFAIVSALPGPMFNISIYLGAIMDGVIGGLVSFIALFLPAFLTVWACLPAWENFRRNRAVKKLLRGLSATAVGFIVSAVYLLWRATAKNGNEILPTCLGIISYLLLEIHDLSPPLILLIGGILSIIANQVHI